MTIQPVRLFGDPVLRTEADPITDFGAATAKLVQDLYDTMDFNQGAGLAAPQIGVSKRAFVFDCGGQRGVVINPVWKEIGSETDTDSEGCLSIPGIHMPTKRFAKVLCEGLDAHGQPVSFECDGIVARAVQHETDHLDGVMFFSRLESDQRKLAMSEVRSSVWFGKAAISKDTLMDTLQPHQ